MRGIARFHRGFSLMEIVIVVMIVGLIATIAAPKLLGTSQLAVDNGLQHSLSVIRTAIDKYSAVNDGALPGANGDEQTFKDNLADYLRGTEFPTSPIGPKNNRVRMMSGTGSILSTIGGTAATHSWVYKYETGDFHVNSGEASRDISRTYDKF
jgi:general secretion pathway protein G